MPVYFTISPDLLATMCIAFCSEAKPSTVFCLLQTGIFATRIVEVWAKNPFCHKGFCKKVFVATQVENAKLPKRQLLHRRRKFLPLGKFAKQSFT